MTFCLVFSAQRFLMNLEIYWWCYGFNLDQYVPSVFFLHAFLILLIPCQPYSSVQLLISHLFLILISSNIYLLYFVSALIFPVFTIFYPAILLVCLPFSLCTPWDFVVYFCWPVDFWCFSLLFCKSLLPNQFIVLDYILFSSSHVCKSAVLVPSQQKTDMTFSGRLTQSIKILLCKVHHIHKDKSQTP